MTHNQKIATVFGGTGFVGTQVVRELARLGYTIKVATRVPERAYFLRPCGVVGQIVPFACNYNDQDSIAQAVKGADYVVNCVAILFEKKKNQFEKVHVDYAAAIAKACTDECVERFVHISSLGVDQSTSQYAKTKLEGEKAIEVNFPKATILRPSVIFGEDDEFFNKFAQMSKILPFLPLIGGGETKFQPVYVGDVADSVIKALTLPTTGDQNPQSKIYELGGPDIVTFKEIYERLFKHTQRKRALIPLPFGFAKFKAFFMQILPNPPLTPDQVESLKTDNIVGDNVYNLEDLGILPKSLATILPTYLSRYRPGGRFGDKNLNTPEEAIE